MSAISQKSITGITSITTPAGVDNIFTVHTNDTTERFRVDSTGNLNIAGISTFSEGIFIPDDKRLSIGNASGNNGDLQLFHTNNNSYVRDFGTGSLLIQGSGVFIQNSNGGTNIASFLENTGVSIPLDLDVDGHTNLDNVNVVGVVTVSQQVHTFAQQITGDNQDSLDFTGSTTNHNRGIAFNGKTALSTGNDNWLRLNNNSEFTSGVYSPQLIRADGGFQTDGYTIVNSTGQINGSRILTGTIPVSQIGTGTKNSSTFYRGDGTFATVTAPAITAINGAANNYVVVSDGGTTVTAESQLRFNGTHLAVGNISPGDHYYSRGIACHAAGVGSVLHLTDSSSGSGQDNGFDILSHDNSAYVWQRETSPIYFGVGANTKWIMDNNGVLYPNNNGGQDLGKSTNRVRNIYTSDLHLSNEAKGGNSIDNTWGDFTIQEGESDLFLINNRNGKKYKFNLTEVS